MLLVLYHDPPSIKLIDVFSFCIGDEFTPISIRQNATKNFIILTWTPIVQDWTLSK